MQDRNGEASEKRDRFFVDEGAAAIFLEDARSHDGTCSRRRRARGRRRTILSVAKFRITEEQYNRIARLVEKKEPVKLRVDLEAAVGDRDLNGTNIVGEIPGGAKKDEVVMIGAHFDSWHGGTGATDNAAGSAVMLEVMRVLSTLHVKLDRTVRIALVERRGTGALRVEGVCEGAFRRPDDDGDHGGAREAGGLFQSR